MYEADLTDDIARETWLNKKRRDDGENVCTFVSDHWTLEYDLAHAELGRSLHTAIALAKNETSRDRAETALTVEEQSAAKSTAETTWNDLKQMVGDRKDAQEYLACKVYEPLLKGVSKPMTAQHLASILVSGSSVETSSSIPNYIRSAIEYVTGLSRTDSAAGEKTNNEGSVTP